MERLYSKFHPKYAYCILFWLSDPGGYRRPIRPYARAYLEYILIQHWIQGKLFPYWSLSLLVNMSIIQFQNNGQLRKYIRNIVIVTM